MLPFENNGARIVMKTFFWKVTFLKDFPGKFGRIPEKFLRNPKNLPAPTFMLCLDGMSNRSKRLSQAAFQRQRLCSRSMSQAVDSKFNDTSAQRYSWDAAQKVTNVSLRGNKIFRIVTVKYMHRL